MHRRTLVCLLAVLAGLLVVTGGGPAAAREHVTVTGKVQVLGAMGGFGGHRTITSLVTAGHTWQLRLPAGVTPPSGSVVRVGGTVSGSTLVADFVRPVRLAPAVSTTGTQKVYVVRVQWAGNPADSVTTADISSAFQLVGSWFDEVSYHQLPGFTVDQDPTYETIAAPSSCSVQTGADQIYDRAVAAAGIDPDNYDHVVAYFPAAGSGCSFAGLASVAERELWLNGDLSQRVITHEMGHNLGLDHSHSLSCVQPGTANQATVSTDCAQPNEYGDPADTMGSEGADLAGHYNAAQKARLGWLGSAAQTVAPCTTLTLNPYETLPASGLVAARVDAGADPATHQPVSYWFEYRHPTGGVDGSAPTGPLPSGLTDGVLLHLTAPDFSDSIHPDYGSDLLDGTPADGAFDFADAAIPANASVAAPQGYGFAVGAVGSTAPLTLSTTNPSVPRNPVAVRQLSGVQLSWQAPTCPGTGASSVTGYHAQRVGASPVDTTTTSAVVPGVPGVAGAEYLVAATNDVAATGAAAVVPPSAPIITGRDYHYSNGVLFGFAPSVSNGGRDIQYYVAHGEPVGGAPPIGDSYYDVSSGQPAEVFLEMAKGDTYLVTISPLFSDFTFGPASAAVRTTFGDTSAPTVRMKAPTSAVTLGGTTPVRWTGSDTGGAGLDSYDVRYRVAAFDSGFGAYVSPSSWQHTTATSASLALTQQGSTYCFSVRARDRNGNVSRYSQERCTSRPLDDSALAAKGAWRTVTGSFYGGSATRSTHKRASLSRTHVRAKHLVLLATVCPTCGKVAVFAGSQKVATVSLRASSTRTSVKLAVPHTGGISGDTVRLKVKTAGKQVTIDGLVVRAV